METETRVELPDGHLVNLSPRPHNPGQYQAYRADYATELSAGSPSRYNFPTSTPDVSGSRHPEDNMFQRAKATKLPVPKTLSEKSRDQRNQTPSPTGIPKPSPTGLSTGGSGGPPTQSGDRNREHCWRKLRDRFEKESPLTQRSSYIRSRNSDQNGSPNQQNARQSNRDRPVNQGGRTGIPSSQSNRGTAPSGRNDLSINLDTKRQWNKRTDDSPQKSERSDTTSDSSPHSHPSVSPITPDDSMTDWEDRFVVHMPSAKEPNPPTMTAQQIAEYQRKIERKRCEGRRGRVSDTSAAPSSRNASAERESPIDRSSEPHPRSQSRPGHKTETFMTYTGQQPQPQSKSPSEKDQTPQQPKAAPAQNSQANAIQNNYYSPEEIGKNRISTIWEESSPSKPKDKRTSKNDGSFLGCKEINGPGTKNPDEILLFASGPESVENLQPRPLAVGGKKKPKDDSKRMAVYQAVQKPAETSNFLHEEWAEISQNSKHVQCSKQSPKTLCQDPNCSDQEIPRPESQGSSKENAHPTESSEKSNEKPGDERSEDDVFIITPTVTRTLIPTSESKSAAQKISGLRRPGGTGQSGTGEAVKAVRAKPQVVSTPSGLRPAGGASQAKSTKLSLTSSKTTPLSNIPKPKDSPNAKDTTTPKDTPPKETPPKEQGEQEKGGSQAASSIRGFIRTSGLGKPSGMTRSPTDSLASILRNGTESLRNRAESFRNGNGSLYFSSRKGSPVSQTSGPSRDNSESSRSERSFRSALSSVKDTPPSSTKPSPIKRNSPTTKRVSIDRAPREMTPPRENTTPREKTPSAEKSPTAEEKRIAAEKQARAERLEKFKEEARSRRATKMAAADEEKLTDQAVDEIAELDGHQVTGSKSKGHLHSNITNVCDDLREGLHPRDKVDSGQGSNALALSMVFEIIVMAITHMHRAVHQGTDSQYAKVLINNVLNMARHCYRVFSRVFKVISQYQATGTWPKAKNDRAISRFLMELLQAVLYLFVLGFGALVVGRAASYVLLVGSWIIWFAKPFAWAVQGIGRALVM
ncbi:hypothetical protein N7532_000602 [Penicillium argentinense]|uniref:NTP binding protein n=1 Tax=Penicillium argentinense TaxID=1131581 RepID=A0A9W9G5U5_9EURO|nr:uncharacterized protein N7532_000602 [Penicillium argentinense]KAJ5112557.1 hypothetical protein N7532_000602 [Penicillium argentinense]